MLDGKILLATTASLLALAGSVQATIYVNENFNYASGPLNGRTGSLRDFIAFYTVCFALYSGFYVPESI